MRLIRLGALVGSVVLLVATAVSIVNNRSELRAEQNARVTAAVLVADQSVESAIARAVAVVGVASELTEPADLTASFGADASACISAGAETRCSGADLSTLSTFGGAASRSAQLDAPAVVVDPSTGSLLVVSRGEVTTSLILPVSALLDERAASTIAGYGADVAIALSTTTAPDQSGPSGPFSDSGRRVVADRLVVADGSGSVDVVASVVDDVDLTGGGGFGYVILLALGTLLMGLAGWTFLLDRRILERRATTDELTGLVNRREFERVSEEVLAAAGRSETGVCLMLIDLNGFKQINDTLGHQFGDQVLQAAAQRLRSAVRDTDVVGRWGGDEFVILLPGVEDGNGVRASAERIGRSLAATPIAGDVSVHGAIGAALLGRHGRELDELISAADLAMYSAKTTGVIYRLADPHAVALAVDEERAASGYVGPDRRRQPEETSGVSRG